MDEMKRFYFVGERIREVWWKTAGFHQRRVGFGINDDDSIINFCVFSDKKYTGKRDNDMGHAVALACSDEIPTEIEVID